MRAPSSAEDSAAVRQRVIAVRGKQMERYRADEKTYSNAPRMPKMIRKYCAITPNGEKLLENDISRLGLAELAQQ